MPDHAPTPPPDPVSRYHRQRILPAFGAGAQRRLGEAHAVVVGVGALGCVSADLLARAGVGRVTLIDRDVVERTNLQRQTLFTEADADGCLPKSVAAARRLRAVNSEIAIHAEVADVVPSNAEELVLDAELGEPGAILDGTDNFETRFLLNDLSVRDGIPFCYAGAVGGESVSASFVPGPGRACLRCLVEPPAPGSLPTCDTSGVFAPAVQLAAARQAADAIRILAGVFDADRAGLVRGDLFTGEQRELPLAGARDPGCPCCAGRGFEFLSAPDPKTVSLCGRDAVQIHGTSRAAMDLDGLAARLGSDPDVSVTHNELLLRATLPGAGLTVFADGRAIVHGTTDPDRARALHARYVSG
ncbi:MAG: ThiF family adenylyltransferase [Phycisphaerales bacterium JB040]